MLNVNKAKTPLTKGYIVDTLQAEAERMKDEYFEYCQPEAIEDNERRARNNRAIARRRWEILQFALDLARQIPEGAQINVTAMDGFDKLVKGDKRV